MVRHNDRVYHYSQYVTANILCINSSSVLEAISLCVMVESALHVTRLIVKIITMFTRATSHPTANQIN